MRLGLLIRRSLAYCLDILLLFLVPTRALARTAVKLLPWEAAHIFGFALAGAVPDVVQVSGLVAANVLVLVYFGMAAATGGRRSVHD